ncbi:hypothetical protein GF362_05435 [Candidatus Dojkabacteria bacterium]|nr:hypothetical protein [Candidatus Dojkabacteria bacterium]
MSQEIKKLIFKKRDFLYDNGMVNLLLIYDELDNKGELHFDGDINLTDTQIEVVANKKSIKSLLKQIYTFYAKSLFSFNPQNKRLYWDKAKRRVIEYKKINFVGASKQEMKWKYSYENIASLKDSKGNKLTLEAISEDIKNNLESYSNSINIDNQKKTIKSISNLVAKNGNVNILKTKDEYIEQEVKKRVDVKEKKILCDICQLNNATGETSLLTQPFDGGLGGANNFEDYLNTSSNNICVWCDLIYQLGSRVAKFFSETDKKLYYYFHSYSLKNLFDIKKELHINDNKVTIVDDPNTDPPTTKQGTSNFHQIEDKDSKFIDYNIWTYGDQDK